MKRRLIACCALLATGVMGMSTPVGPVVEIVLGPPTLEIELPPPGPVTEAAAELDLATLEAVADAELAEQRGGFAWEGMEIRLGADIRSYLDGELVLQTLVNWDEAGASTSRLVSGALTPAAAAELQAGVLSTGSISMRVGDADVFLANQGQTALLHRVDGPVQSVVVNTASNTALRQEMDVQLDLSNYEAFGAQALDSRLLSQVQSMMDESAIGGISR